jgi:hypothetical protein
MNEIHETFGGNLVRIIILLSLPTDHSSIRKPSLLIHKLSLLCYPLNSPFPQKLIRTQASVTSWGQQLKSALKLSHALQTQHATISFLDAKVGDSTHASHSCIQVARHPILSVTLLEHVQ